MTSDTTNVAAEDWYAKGFETFIRLSDENERQQRAADLLFAALHQRIPKILTEDIQHKVCDSQS